MCEEVKFEVRFLAGTHQFFQFANETPDWEIIIEHLQATRTLCILHLRKRQPCVKYIYTCKLPEALNQQQVGIEHYLEIIVFLDCFPELVQILCSKFS